VTTNDCSSGYVSLHFGTKPVSKTEGLLEALKKATPQDADKATLEAVTREIEHWPSSCGIGILASISRPCCDECMLAGVKCKP
jgi:hypothetical protein